MDPKLVYVKTPIGDEAVRQSTRVVERNLRMILVQVDGKLSIVEMTAKIGNVQLVEDALRKLEEGGFIAPGMEGVSVWEEGKRLARAAPMPVDTLSKFSEFSTFAPKSVRSFDAAKANSVAGNFSTFGKSVFPSSLNVESEVASIKPSIEVALNIDYKTRFVSIVKWLGTAFVGLVGLFFAVVFFYPYARLIPDFEAAASHFLQTPVQIAHIDVTFAPWPQLQLRDIKIGETADSRIETMRIASSLWLLKSGARQISMVDVSGAVFTANRIVSFPFFNVNSAPTTQGISIREIRFTQSQVTAQELALRDIAGAIRFKPDGSVENALFQAVDRSIQFSAMPSAQGLMLSIEGLGWKPFGPLISFDSLQATGLLQKDKLFIQNLDTTFLGGIMKGAWLFDWSNGLTLAGDASLSHLDCRKVSAAIAPSLKLEGDLAGVFRLRASGSDWNAMWQSAEATLEADVTRGIFYGVDIGEAARRGVGSVARAGATKFDRLQAALIVNTRQISGRNIQMSAGMMTASGQFVVSHERQVESNLTVGIKTSASNLRVPVRVSGILPDLIAVSGSRHGGP